MFVEVKSNNKGFQDGVSSSNNSNKYQTIEHLKFIKKDENKIQIMELSFKSFVFKKKTAITICYCNPKKKTLFNKCKILNILLDKKQIIVWRLKVFKQQFMRKLGIC